MTADQVQALSAVATFFAACVAVWAAFRAPQAAAQFAEEMRVANQNADEKRRMKFFVFTTLMQYRSQIINPNSIAALNLIDVVFIDAPEVRDAWKDFCVATVAQPFSTDAVIERYHGIIEKISRDLGLSDQISISNIRNSYYPKGLGEIDEAAFLETQDKLSRLKNPAQQIVASDLNQTSSTSRP